MTEKDTGDVEVAVNNKKFDLGNYVNPDEATGEFLNLLNPATGEPLLDDNGEQVGIYLLGKDSEVYRRAQRTITNRRLSRKGSSAITAERIESEANEVLAHCTASWQGIVYQGDEVDCSFSMAKRIYTQIPWVKEQVDEFIAERANYLGK